MTEPDEASDRSVEQDVIDKLLDVFVYAPLGAAVEFKDFIPEMAAKGRAAAADKLPMYRTIGEFAVKEAVKKAGKQTGGLTDILASLGLVPSDGSDQDTARGDGTAPERTPDQDPAASGDADNPTAPIPDEESGDIALPIEHYDELPAVEIVKLLSGLEPAERDIIAAHEKAYRGRRTILGKLDQLASRT